MEVDKAVLHAWEGIIPPGESLLGSWFVVFVNNRLVLQERILVLTNKAYYRVKAGGLFFTHFKRYRLQDVTNIRIGKIRLGEHNALNNTTPSRAEFGIDNAVCDNTSEQNPAGGIFKKIAMGVGLFGVEKEEEREYAVRIFTLNNENKTYIRIRTRIDDKANKETLLAFGLAIVDALFSCDPEQAAISSPKLPPSPSDSDADDGFNPLKFFKNVFFPEDEAPKKESLPTHENSDSEEEEEIIITNKSNLVSADILLQVIKHTPPALYGRAWSLCYDVNINGGSLNNFYYTIKKGQHSSIVMFLKDERQQVFGGYVSEGWQPNTGVYGSGQNFLFKVHMGDPLLASPAGVSYYHWKKDSGNYCFQMSNNDYLAMGSGGSGFGLYIDNELLNGNSDKCDTYGNESLASSVMFKIVGMEVWSAV